MNGRVRISADTQGGAILKMLGRWPELIEYTVGGISPALIPRGHAFDLELSLTDGSQTMTVRIEAPISQELVLPTLMETLTYPLPSICTVRGLAAANASGVVFTWEEQEMVKL